VIKQKKINLLLSSLILTALLVVFAIYYSRHDNDNILPEIDNGNLYLTQLAFSLYNMEDMPVNDLVIYPGLRMSDSMKLSQIVNQGVLVVRISGRTCKICSDFAIRMIAKNFPGFEDDIRIVFIASDIEDRLMKDQNEKRVYTITKESYLLPFDEFAIPYYFYVDQELKCKLFFIPDSSYPGITEFYLKTIRRRYFDQAFIYPNSTR